MRPSRSHAKPLHRPLGCEQTRGPFPPQALEESSTLSSFWRILVFFPSRPRPPHPRPLRIHKGIELCTFSAAPARALHQCPVGWLGGATQGLIPQISSSSEGVWLGKEAKIWLLLTVASPEQHLCSAPCAAGLAGRQLPVHSLAFSRAPGGVSLLPKKAKK